MKNKSYSEWLTAVDREVERVSRRMSRNAVPEPPATRSVLPDGAERLAKLYFTPGDGSPNEVMHRMLKRVVDDLIETLEIA